MQRISEQWYEEAVGPTLSQQLKITGVVHEGRTRYQDVRIIETEAMGRTLVLDGRTQSAERDEFIYHEALVHPALVAHPAPRRVCIAGGAEGATLREVLRHRSVRQAVMVDIDGELVDLCRRFLPQWHCHSFDDSRATIIFDDARAFLQAEREPFDVIMMDVTDPSEDGPSQALYTNAFYRMALSRLAPGGLLVTQAGAASVGACQVFTSICRTLTEAAGHVLPYKVDMLSFASDWGFAMVGRDGPPPIKTAQEIDRRIAQEVESELRSYDGAAHAGMFGLPRWLRRQIAGCAGANGGTCGTANGAGTRGTNVF